MSGLDPNADSEPSLDDCARALERTADPGEQSELWRAIARVHLSRCAYTEAEAALARAVTLTPDHPMALSGWATVLECLARHPDARAAFERAVAIDPACARARVNLSLHYLLHGRYREAWPHYRSRLGSMVDIRVSEGIPPWDGQDTPAELIVVAEQGIGDLVQFCRYAPLLQLASPRVSFLGAAKLHALLASAGLFQTFYGLEEPFHPQPGAQWLPLMALPELMSLTREQVLLDAPYLRADPEHTQRWRSRFGPRSGLRVGIGWQGNPLMEREGHAGRSMPLELLAPLAAVEGVELVSLQKGPGSEQLEHCSFRARFTPLQPEVDRTWDLLETLAILEQCDLVISTDTSLAHLAAALGRPTWILLKAVPDWRWGLEGEATPWYPCARLFRQRAIGDWPGVVERVAAALVDVSISTAKAAGPGMSSPA